MGDADKTTGTGARPSRELLALLVAMGAIGPATMNIIVPALPALTVRLNTDSGTVQLALSLYLLSFATAQLALGPLSDRFGRRPVMMGGLALASVAAYGAMLVSSIEALIFMRIVQAVGACTGIVIGRAIVRDLYDRDRAAAMIGLVTTAMVVVPMISPLIGGILDTLFGWESIFLFIAVLTTIVFLWSVRALPETRRTVAGEPPRKLSADWGALMGSRRFHGYVLAGALGSVPYFTFLGGGPHVVVTQMGRTSAEYGLWFAVTSLGYMSGNFSVSRLAQRFGIDRMIVAGVIAEVIGAGITLALVLMVADPTPAMIFLPQFLISYGNGLLLANAIAGAVSIRAQAAGAASGLTGFAQMALGAAATQAVSILLAGAHTALPMALMMLGAAAATGVSFWLLVRR